MINLLARKTFLKYLPYIYVGLGLLSFQLVNNILPLWIHNREARVIVSMFGDCLALAVGALLLSWILKRKEAGNHTIDLQTKILDSALDCIFMFKPDGRIIYANQSCLDNYGYNQEEFLQLKVEDLLPPEQRTYLPQRIKEAMANGTVSFESRHLRKDGSMFPLNIQGHVIQVNGQPVMLNISQDITERKAAEATLKRAYVEVEEKVIQRTTQLRETLRLTQQVIDTIPSPLFYKGVDGRYQGVNQAFLQLYGKRMEEVVGKTLYEIFPPDIAEAYEQKDQDLFANPGTQLYETYNYDAQGQRRDLTIHKGTFTNLNEEVSGLAGVMVDITDQKDLQFQLEQAQARLRYLLDEIPAAVIMISFDGMVMIWNKTAEKMFGYTAKEVVWKQLPIVPQDEEHLRLDHLEKVERGESISGLIVHPVKKDGSQIECCLSVGPLMDKDQASSCMLVLIQIGEEMRPAFEIPLFTH